MEIKQDVRPITYLKNHTAELVRRVSDEGRTVLITQNGEAKVVVMEAAQYDRMRASLAMLKLVLLGESSLAAAPDHSSREVFAQAESMLRGTRLGR